jgi:hypothetical protein
MRIGKIPEKPCQAFFIILCQKLLFLISGLPRLQRAQARNDGVEVLVTGEFRVSDKLINNFCCLG